MGKLLVFLVSIVTLLVIAIVIFSEVFINLPSCISQRKLDSPEVIDLQEIQFRSYLKNFSKNYENYEYKLRLRNFKASLKEIVRLNQNAGTALYGLTKFSDMSAEEFSSRMLMKEGLNDTGCEEYYKHCDRLNTRKPRVFYNKQLPSKFDWRDHAGVVGPVLDQRGCLACWAFSVVGVMESKMVIQKSRYYHRLSVQELIDCSELTNHCHGGNVAFAMKYLCRNMLPITWEEEYPLTLQDENCRFKPPTGVLLDSFTVHCNVQVIKIIEFIVNEGPVTAAVNADNWAHYLGGIIQYHCSSSPLRHVVQIVGYDFTTQPPHFIIKNSWGKDFGIEGYVKIAMGNFICGIGKQIGYLSVR